MTTVITECDRCGQEAEVDSASWAVSRELGVPVTCEECDRR